MYLLIPTVTFLLFNVCPYLIILVPQPYLPVQTLCSCLVTFIFEIFYRDFYLTDIYSYTLFQIHLPSAFLSLLNLFLILFQLPPSSNPIVEILDKEFIFLFDLFEFIDCIIDNFILM